MHMYMCMHVYMYINLYTTYIQTHPFTILNAPLHNVGRGVYTCTCTCMYIISSANVRTYMYYSVHVHVHVYQCTWSVPFIYMYDDDDTTCIIMSPLFPHSLMILHCSASRRDS